MDKQSLLVLYSKGSRVWIQHPVEIWESAEIIESYDGKKLSVLTESGDKREIKTEKSDELPPLRNPDILIGENDLTSLSYLHEPAVLYNLLVRFCHKNSIYTYCGIVLVAINPYQELPIYGNDTIWAYRGRAMGDLDPHIFAIAEEAYNRMESEKKDQSIIVSGESGAGKTVSAKYVMRYFATVSGSSKETQIEKKVLASSPIMEAIGNAKTTRNDNSSRFGKFIELQFNKYYQIVGASMRTYLLEKSRVVFQAPEERNYHIFYQLCAARNQYPDLKLDDAKEYEFLCSEHIIAGVNDEKCFQETKHALDTLGFDESDQLDIFYILSSILFLGNINISENPRGAHGDSEASFIKDDDVHLVKMAELLKLNSRDLRKWLCHRRIVSMKETFDKPMNANEARGARDALAKYMYAELFCWIVKMINRALETTNEKHRFIGVLDIYGFETFEINSFEQFCINYANEKLQQQFNLHVFKLDQEEYLKEDIEWKFIDFYDNQPCIDLIETRLGILDLLDEECRMPKGTDDSWADKLYGKCTKWNHFAKPRFGTSSFIIKHFADSVEYQTFGFLDKNKDTVIEEQVVVLKDSGNKLLRKLFETGNNNKLNVASHAATIGHSNKMRVSIASHKQMSATSPANKQHKKTVGSQFRDSLNALMATLNATTPHYIRCIKPNDSKEAFVYTPQRAVQQLRACGVLETIRISAAGFPSRILYTDFHSRYKVLSKSSQRKKDIRESCEFLMNTFIKDEDKYKYGKTKIFFRAGQVAFLERLRSDKMKACLVILQKTVRGYLARKRYLKSLNAAKLLQRVTRGFLARRRVHHIRRNRASITIQKNVRRWIQYRKYQQIRRSVLKIQCYGRGLLARQKYQNMRENKAASKIQATVRGWLQRKKYLHSLESIVKCQCTIRRFLARKQLKELKREARSVEHVKKLNKGLENKIISMQQKIGEMQKEINSLRNVSAELNETKQKLEALKTVEAELKTARVQLAERDVELNNVVNLLQQERYSSEELKNLKQKEIEEYEKRCERLEHERESLMKDIESVKESATENKVNIEEMIRSKIEQEKLILLREQDQDRDAYQKLLTERNILEARVEAMEKELMNQGHGHYRSLSDASTISIQDNSRGSPDGTASVVAEKEDVSLLLKLHQKLKSLEFERDKLTKKIDNTERIISGSPYNDRARDSFKIQELEMENEKLRSSLEKLRKAVAESHTEAASNELIDQFREMETELIRRREECSQLRNVLVNNTEGLKSLAKSNYSPEADLESINEDGELVLAFEAQKKINRQLEEELQREKTLWTKEKEDFKEEIARLKEDNERQQQLLAVNLSKSPQSQAEAYLASEVNRVVAENLEFRDKYDLLQKECRKIKKQLQRYLEECNEKNANSTIIENNNSVNTSVIANIVNSELPSVRKKEKNYLGMFEFSKDDIQTILKALINDLKPSIAINLLPGLPAYILFMCVRHTDFVNDEDKVRLLLCGFINNAKKTVKRKTHDLETSILWLSNTVRLLHTLKQYSGEQAFQEENTPTQNAQCLQNFDLYEYRQVLSDQAVYFFQCTIRTMQNKIKDLALVAILEFEAIPGLSSGKHLTRSLSVTTAETPVNQTPDTLQKQLTEYYNILSILGVDYQVIVQVFQQLFYFICATIMNNMLLRKELCHWTKGMQIRYNLSHLEQWARDLNLGTSETANILEMLQPIIQAAQLLQARKTDNDVNSICDMCNKMTTNQIIKILNLYTPGDDYEEKVSMSFIKKVQETLLKRKDTEQPTLLMDTKFQFSVRFPFNPSNIRLEDIEIPDTINLPMLRKI
ncbi:unconventional myosin-Va isoform X2 [Planococcus citri]|uniref:unconventional myosin-Va isoform X2 n=1 Tax=Planococcus citri TaxID=170843 RepID=UPI0031F8EE52